MIVVIPSCRQIRLDYLEPLIDFGARFIIVDDTEGCIQVDHPQFRVYDWSDRRRLLGKLDYAMPRRNGACRDFGFYIAWKESDDDEIILALDDDCLIEDADYAHQVVHRLKHGADYIATGLSTVFNTFDLYEEIDGRRIFPRGFPYSQRGDYVPWRFEPSPPQPVMFNLGLWKDVFDVNAIDKLHLERWVFPEAKLRVAAVTIPVNALLSLCSGNMHFRRAVIPAIYQLPMHVEVIPNGFIDRYGDIWGGFILKTLLDIRGDRLSVGSPMVRHLRDGDCQRNIRLEHLSHLVNDEFIRLLEVTRGRIAPSGYLDMMAHLREEFVRAIPSCSPILGRYLIHLTEAMGAWLTLLQ